MELPAHLVADYWAQVRALLIEKHHLTEEQADTEIKDFREIVEPRTGATIYNADDPSRMAEGLARSLQQGGTRRIFASWIPDTLNTVTN